MHADKWQCGRNLNIQRRPLEYDPNSQLYLTKWFKPHPKLDTTVDAGNAAKHKTAERNATLQSQIKIIYFW